MADPNGKGWVMNSPATAGELQRITVSRPPVFVAGGNCSLAKFQTRV